MSRIILCGVNLTGMGGLACFQEALSSLARRACGDGPEIIALVHKAELFDIPGVRFVGYPAVKASWLRRLKFEYLDLWRISKDLNADIWISMHDISPRVQARRQIVYCHNPAPFYRLRFQDAAYDWSFGLFALLYRFLYGINIRSNAAVIVQQEWLREEFKRRYRPRMVIVAHPDGDKAATAVSRPDWGGPSGRPYRFFYPSYPRVFKNFEVVLDAVRVLEQRGHRDFEVALTLEKGINRFTRHLWKRYGDLQNVRWLGLIKREEVLRRYETTDCLLFPSRLETWGFPISEFRPWGKPILAADLPYAHETIGDYEQAAFFSPSDAEELSRLMADAIEGKSVFKRVTAQPAAEPFAANWDELWKLLLEEERKP
ncbi:MAG: glycosyltransferase [Acidobacteriota bacterium]